MSSSFYRRQADQHRRNLERELKKRADAEARAASEEQAALRSEEQASRTSTPSSAAGKLRDAERRRKKAGELRKTAATASKAVADLQKKLHDAEARASKDEQREQDNERRKAESKRRGEETRRRFAEQRRLREEQAREGAREREFTDLAIRTQALERELARASREAPKKITVLFLAGTIEGGPHPLRLDQEVREIQRRVRESEHRDSIEFEYSLATRISDILQALNQYQPDVVHFAGHGNKRELLFEGNDGQPLALSNDQLGVLLHAPPRPIRLVVFNSCESSDLAVLACDFVSAAIGMDESVADASAKQFAGQFYNALGFGHSLALAFTQAQAQARTTGQVTGNPRLYTAEGLEPDEIVLVAPA